MRILVSESSDADVVIDDETTTFWLEADIERYLLEHITDTSEVVLVCDAKNYSFVSGVGDLFGVTTVIE